MKEITLGKTGLRTVANAFGALPLQRVDLDTAVSILHRAYEGGMTYFDTARAYSDSEEKLGAAFHGMWDKVILATKTHSSTPEEFWKDLETSLRLLRTDCIDIYQLHQAPRCYAPGDGTGMYECMLEARERGMIRHIGITAHRWDVAMEAAGSGLYETLMFPFSYLTSEKELQVLERCREHQVAFIAMKSLAGGLITRSEAAMAYIASFDGVLPIWGIQKHSELEEWLSYMDRTPVLTEELKEFIRREREELSGDFCRGCGYCMPCPQGIVINNCARMSLFLRRSPSAGWLSPRWQEEMKKIETCLHCGKCAAKCPYGLRTPELLQKNYEDYQRVLSGEVKV